MCLCDKARRTLHDGTILGGCGLGPPPDQGVTIQSAQDLPGVKLPASVRIDDAANNATAR